MKIWSGTIQHSDFYQSQVSRFIFLFDPRLVGIEESKSIGNQIWLVKL